MKSSKVVSYFLIVFKKKNIGLKIILFMFVATSFALAMFFWHYGDNASNSSNQKYIFADTRQLATMVRWLSNNEFTVYVESSSAAHSHGGHEVLISDSIKVGHCGYCVLFSKQTAGWLRRACKGRQKKIIEITNTPFAHKVLKEAKENDSSIDTAHPRNMDEHFWTTPEATLFTLQSLYSELSKITSNKAEMDKRKAILEKRLFMEIEATKVLLGNKKLSQNRVIFSVHGRLDFFAKEYNLSIKELFIPSNEVEESIDMTNFSYLKHLVKSGSQICFITDVLHEQRCNSVIKRVKQDFPLKIKSFIVDIDGGLFEDSDNVDGLINGFATIRDAIAKCAFAKDEELSI